MSKPKDLKLYEKIKKEIINKYKPSAYRSGMIVREYKKEYEKKYGNKNAYEGKKKTKEGLSRWFDEKWLADDGKIGYSSKTSIYRPTMRITKNTPITFSELTEKQIKKAKEIKGKTGRVKNFAKL